MTLKDWLPMTALRTLRGLSRKLWVRVVGMGLLSFVAVGLSQVFETLLPEGLARSLSGTAADRLLDIIANAMLAVTIFSITVMVSVYRASSSQFTPRVHRLIMQDRTTQNTLSVFIGAYVFALTAIILRELGVYVDDRAFVLFWMIVAVLVVIVVYLIRWVLHLQTFGSLIDTTRQLEEVTRERFKERLRDPCLGATPLVEDLPENATPIAANETGYVQHIYPEALQELAEKAGVTLYLPCSIGHFVFLNAPLVYVDGTPDWEEDEDFETRVLACIDLGDLRTYEQDPRFGLIALGEVASKALSPGINDPGTAIDVVGRIGRILSDYQDEETRERDVVLSRLYVEPLDPGDLLEDGFAALARDGRDVPEVQQRLQAVLAGLMRHPDEGLKEAARHAAAQFLDRALDHITFPPDRDRLIASADPAVRPDA